MAQRERLRDSKSGLGLPREAVTRLGTEERGQNEVTANKGTASPRRPQMAVRGR